MTRPRSATGKLCGFRKERFEEGFFYWWGTLKRSRKHLLQDSKTGYVLLWTHQLEIPKEIVCILVKYIHASREYYVENLKKNDFFKV